MDPPSPPSPMLLSLCDSLSVSSPGPPLYSSIYFTLFFGFHPEHSGPLSRFLFISPMPSVLDLYVKIVSINPLE